MITKGIIKKLYTTEDNHFIVYIPLLQKANMGEGDASMPATLICTPGINNALNIGDIVYVGFEDNNYSRPVILGKLFTNDAVDNVTTTVIAKNAYVVESASLPVNTTVNGVNLDDVATKLNRLANDTAIKAGDVSYDGIGISDKLTDVKKTLDYILEKLS